MVTSEKDYHNEYYARLSIKDEDLLVQTEGFWQALAQNPIGDLYRCLLQQLGEIRGKHILEYGCGSGQIAVFLAHLGAKVNGFDVSRAAIALATRRARVNHVADRALFQTMEASSLAYKSGIFDCIVGRWVLHHLDKHVLEVCGKEMARVLKPGGKALFIEPLGDNPLIEFFRRHPWYARNRQYRSMRESTMKRSDILEVGKAFNKVIIHEFHFLYMLKRIIARQRVRKALYIVDEYLLKACPSLKRYCGECVIEYLV